MYHNYTCICVQIFGGSTGNARPEATRVCLLMSDGKANVEQSMTLDEANQLKSIPGGGPVVYTALIGVSVDDYLMREIASDPSFLYSTNVQTRDDVDAHAQAILNTICAL